MHIVQDREDKSKVVIRKNITDSVHGVQFMKGFGEGRLTFYFKWNKTWNVKEKRNIKVEKLRNEMVKFDFLKL